MLKNLEKVDSDDVREGMRVRVFPHYHTPRGSGYESHRATYPQWGTVEKFLTKDSVVVDLDYAEFVDGEYRTEQAFFLKELFR